MADQEGSVVSATRDAEGWHLQLLFPTREALSTTYDDWDTDQWDVSIERIVSYDDRPLETHGLTDEQHTPDCLQSLAAELDISHQALSERFRRANRALVTKTVCNSEESEEPAMETTDPVQMLE